MRRPKKLRWLRRLLTLSLLGAAAAYGGRYWYQNQPLSPSAPQYETEVVSLGDLKQAVTASGQLNPVVKVEVGSQISGILQRLMADYNSNVKEGDLLAQIDPGTYEANFIQAEGNLASAKASLEYARLNAERSKALRDNKLNPQAEYEKAVVDLHQAEAAVKISEGTLKKAQVDLARCKIYAPIDGMVISRDVNVGQTVAASLSAPKLFVIANDLSKMQIEAKVSEADIGRIEVGQKVNFTVDAFPGQTFRGQVTQIRNAPVVDQNVVAYETIVEVKNPELKLKPGMTANVSIVVAERDNVLKVPNAALRFRPPKTVEVVKPDEVAKTDSSKTEVEDGTAKGDKKSDVAKPKKEKKDKRKVERAVCVLKGGALHSLKLKLGISDGRETEVIEGLKEGDSVVIEMAEVKEDPALTSRLLAVFRKKS